MTAWFNVAHRWNSLICPPLGYLLNFVLLWLIIHRTPQEMRVHSRILLQTVGTDMAMLIIETIGQLAYTFSNGKPTMTILFFDGYLIRPFVAAFGPVGLYLLGSITLYLNSFILVGISVQFIYRYLLLNRNIHVSLHRYLLLLAGPLILDIFVVFAIFYLEPISTTKMKPTDMISNIFNNDTAVDLQDENLIFFTGTLEKIWANNIFVAALIPLYVGSFLTNFFLGWLMIRFVNQHATFNPRMKELNRQLTRNLIILATFPFLLELCSTLIITQLASLSLATADDKNGITENKSAKTLSSIPLFCTLAFHWLPVLNPLASILVNRPYRDATIFFSSRNMFSSCRANTSVSPIIHQ